MMIAFTFGSDCGSEGISVPAADCRAAKSLLRFNMASRLFIGFPSYFALIHNSLYASWQSHKVNQTLEGVMERNVTAKTRGAHRTRPWASASAFCGSDERRCEVRLYHLATP